MKYEIVDLSKSLFQETVLIEASSPKVAAEKHFGFAVERCIGQHGYILVASKSYPCRTYLYKRHLTQPAPDAGESAPLQTLSTPEHSATSQTLSAPTQRG